MRDDFHSVFTGGSGNRYPYAHVVKDPVRDDDGSPIPSARRSRRLVKGWREDWCRRYHAVDRFLRSRLGRPWNEVLGEIARAMAGEPSARAVIEHAQRIVCTGGLVDGRLVTARGYRVHGFYVDGNGLLAELPTEGYRDSYVRRANAHLLDPTSMLLAEGHVLSLADGVWYECRWVVEMVGARGSYPGFASRKCVGKRQLGRREIDRHGLRDWPELVARFKASIRNRSFDRGLKRRMEAMADEARRALVVR